MKKLSQLLIILLLFTTCKERKLDSKNTIYNPPSYTILEGACGSIVFDSKPYDNLEAAIKTLEKENKNLLPKNHKIKKQRFTIDFNKDDRVFYGISFVNQDGLIETLSLSHVVDTNGNIYYIDWCKD